VLVERAEKLRASIQNLATLRRTAGESKAYETRATDIDNASKTLSTLALLGEALTEQGISVSLPTDILKGLQSRTEQILTNYRQAPESIVGPENELRSQYWRPLEEHGASIRGVFLTGWQAHVASRLRFEQAQLLDVLSSVPEYVSHAAKMRALYDQARRLTSGLPDDSAFAQIDAIELQIREAWTRLPQGLPEDVQTFISAAATATARLEQLTPGVAAWLKANDLDSSIRISWSRS